MNESNIVTYINSAIFSRRDLILSLFFPRLPLSLHAKKVGLRQRQLHGNDYISAVIPIQVKIESYSGNNHHVRQMMDYMHNNLKYDLVGAYVHGSLGTYEEVSYSDFDALVVLKDVVFESPRRLAHVARKLYDAQSIMLDFDPLQHHGWFVLTEAQLRAYPDHYFPVELFSYAKSLFPDRGCELTISVATAHNQYRETFLDLSGGIIKQIEKGCYPENMHQLKGLLSQFVLLPALYIQARDGKGIFKKHSFKAARVDFSPTEWGVMDDVSSLREKWSYRMSPLTKRILSRPGTLSRFFAKRFGPPIPPAILNDLTKEFYERMRYLAMRMVERLV